MRYGGPRHLKKVTRRTPQGGGGDAGGSVRETARGPSASGTYSPLSNTARRRLAKGAAMPLNSSTPYTVRVTSSGSLGSSNVIGAASGESWAAQYPSDPGMHSA